MGWLNVLGQLVNTLWNGIAIFDHMPPDRRAVEFAGNCILAAFKGHDGWCGDEGDEGDEGGRTTSRSVSCLVLWGWYKYPGPRPHEIEGGAV